MSARYIFTAMGLYPLNPVPGSYLTGSPLFRKLTLDLPSGRRLSFPPRATPRPASTFRLRD